MEINASYMETQTACSGPTVCKRGWLEKSPPISQFSGFKGCRKRYFILFQVDPKSSVFLKKNPKKGKTKKKVEILHDYYLVYWDTDDVQRKPIRVIPILGIYQVSKFRIYENVYRNMFSLTTNDRIYLFSAENETEMNSWSKELTMAIENIKNKEIPQMTSSCFDREGQMAFEEIYDDILHTINERCDSITSFSTMQHTYNQLSGSNLHLTCEEINEVRPYHVSPYQGTQYERHLDITQDTSCSMTYEDMSYNHNKLFDQSAMSQTQVSDITSSMLQQYYNKPTPAPRRQTDSGLVSSTTKNICEPKQRTYAYTVGTSDLRINDIKRTSDVNTNTTEDDEIKPATSEFRNKTEIGKFDRTKQYCKSTDEHLNIKYNLNISEESVILSMLNPHVQSLVESGVRETKEGLQVMYGHYEITIRSR